MMRESPTNSVLGAAFTLADTVEDFAIRAAQCHADGKPFQHELETGEGRLSYNDAFLMLGRLAALEALLDKLSYEHDPSGKHPLPSARDALSYASDFVGQMLARDYTLASTPE